MERAKKRGDPAREVRRSDCIYGGHLVLAGSMALWRALAATPGFAAADGGTFESSTIGRLLVMATVFAGVAMLFVVTIASLAQWRDVRTSALSILLVLAIAWRTQFDVFDLAYLIAVAILSVIWFHDARSRVRSAASGAGP